jgi:hypothetical protein
MTPKRAAVARRHEPYARVPRREILATTVELVREQGVSNAGMSFARRDTEEVAIRLAAVTEGLAVHVVLEHPGRTREHYVASALKAAALELGCEYLALQRAAGQVPIPGQSLTSKTEGVG